MSIDICILWLWYCTIKLNRTTLHSYCFLYGQSMRSVHRFFCSVCLLSEAVYTLSAWHIKYIRYYIVYIIQIFYLCSNIIQLFSSLASFSALLSLSTSLYLSPTLLSFSLYIKYVYLFPPLPPSLPFAFTIFALIKTTIKQHHRVGCDQSLTVQP